MFNFSSQFPLLYCTDVAEQESISEWFEVSLRSARRDYFCMCPGSHACTGFQRCTMLELKHGPGLEQAHSWPVWMVGDGQGAVPASGSCTHAWADHRGGTRTVLSPPPGHSSHPELLPTLAPRSMRYLAGISRPSEYFGRQLVESGSLATPADISV